MVWQYSAARERRDNRTLNLQIGRAQEVADGTRAVRKDRFVKFTGDKPGIDQDRIDAARVVIGLKGYVTNIPRTTLDGPGVVAAYHDLFQVEKSFRMAKTDLRARPVFHHKRDSIEAHLTIVFAALAIGRDLEKRTGTSIRCIVRELRPLRDITIHALGHDRTAATPPGPAAAAILDALNRRTPRPTGHEVDRRQARWGVPFATDDMPGTIRPTTSAGCSSMQADRRHVGNPCCYSDEPRRVRPDHAFAGAPGPRSKNN